MSAGLPAYLIQWQARITGKANRGVARYLTEQTRPMTERQNPVSIKILMSQVPIARCTVAACLGLLVGCGGESAAEKRQRWDSECDYARYQLDEIRRCRADAMCANGYGIMDRMARDERSAEVALEFYECSSGSGAGKSR